MRTPVKRALLSLAILASVAALGAAPVTHAARTNASIARCTYCYHPLLWVTGDSNTGVLTVTGTGYTPGNFVTISVSDAYTGAQLFTIGTLPYADGHINALVATNFAWPCTYGVQAYDPGSRAWSTYETVSIGGCVG
jgi:hypothetical protein